MCISSWPTVPKSHSHLRRLEKSRVELHQLVKISQLELFAVTPDFKFSSYFGYNCNLLLFLQQLTEHLILIFFFGYYLLHYVNDTSLFGRQSTQQLLLSKSSNFTLGSFRFDLAIFLDGFLYSSLGSNDSPSHGLNYSS